jgi:hypothetical protein
MVKRILVGIVWFVVLYFGACVLTGAIAGGIAGGKDPEHASVVGREAGRHAVLALRMYYLVGAAAISIVGASRGILPGTRIKPKNENSA